MIVIETAESVVRKFWSLMATNDFHLVTAMLDDGFVMDWPQSNERIRGPANFAQMNAEYPTSAPWSFRINRLIAAGTSVVTQVSITNGVQSAEPISFFTVVNGKITSLTEYWPDPFPAAENRSHLVEPIK